METVTNYPAEVEKYLDALTASLDDFFKEEQIETYGPKVFRPLAGKILFEQWKAGDGIDIDRISDDEFVKLLNDTTVSASIESLKAKGLIDGIEVDDDEMFFVTKEGRAVYAEIKQ